MRTIRERVEDSYTDEEPDKVSKYLDWLNAVISDLTQNIRRSALLILLLAAAFELVSTSPRTQITFSIFSISKGSVVLQFIPALVSYLYLQTFIDGVRINSMRRAFRETFSYWSSSASANDLDAFILPTFYLFWSPGFATKSSEANEGIGNKIERFIGSMFFFVTVIAIAAFELQAYHFLLKPGSSTPDITWFVSLGISAFCGIMFLAFGFAVTIPGPRRTAGNR